MGTVFSGVDAAETLYREYVTAAHDRLDEEGPLRDACTAWTAFVRASHGAVFESLDLPDERGRPADSPAERVFVDALYYDFLVDCLLDALETETGVTVTNRDPRTNTDALPVAFSALHDRVLTPAAGRDRVRAAVDVDTLRTLGPDDLRDLYRDVLPQPIRLALGEYYTPRGVADLALDALDLDLGSASVLDPGCGSGAFLVGALDRKRAARDDDPDATLSTLLGSVFGIDLNPVAVKSAKLAVCAALFDLLSATDRDGVAVPVFLTDALGLSREDEIQFRGESLSLSVDAVVGNPPWVPWERLPERVKTRWRDRYVDELGLQPHEGAAALLGHSNDDVSIPYAWVCMHRYLRPGGEASFVLKRDVMRGPAGVVLRRLQVGDRSLALEHVHDLAALEPFPDVGANAAVYTFRADAEPSFPVDATVWRSGPGGPVEFTSLDTLQATATPRSTGVVPLDPTDTSTAWISVDAERAALGDCAHEIRHGLKDDCNDVFDVERADLARLDDETVYPYLQSRHVRKYGVTGHDLRLVPQRAAGEDNESRLRRRYPQTYDYLSAHRDELAARSSTWLDRGPFYSVFGLGEYTWAPYKVIWCRLGFKPDFAVVSTRNDPDLGERLVVPGDHYMFVASHDERAAHFLCALLNAAPYQRTLRELASGGKASLSKSVVSELWLPPWPGTATAEQLADRSMAAHELVANGAAADDPRLAEIQADIDRLAEAALASGSLADAVDGASGTEHVGE